MKLRNNILRLKTKTNEELPQGNFLFKEKPGALSLGYSGTERVKNDILPLIRCRRQTPGNTFLNPDSRLLTRFWTIPYSSLKIFCLFLFSFSFPLSSCFTLLRLLPIVLLPGMVLALHFSPQNKVDAAMMSILRHAMNKRIPLYDPCFVFPAPVSHIGILRKKELCPSIFHISTKTKFWTVASIEQKRKKTKT